MERVRLGVSDLEVSNLALGTMAFGWTADDTLEIKMCAYQTPFTLTYRLRFEAGQVTLDQETNVAFGPTKRPTLVGRLESSGQSK